MGKNVTHYTTAVLEGFVSLGTVESIDEGLAGACRVQPFGEVAQGIVAKTGLQPQLSGASRTHQVFDGKETGGPQPLSSKQSPKQCARRFARLQTAIAAILEETF
jgi:hypothetical protein